MTPAEFQNILLQMKNKDVVSARSTRFNHFARFNLFDTRFLGSFVTCETLPIMMDSDKKQAPLACPAAPCPLESSRCM